MMRPSTLIVIAAFCASCAAQTPTVAARQPASTRPGNPRPSTLVTNLWTLAGGMTTQHTFNVDLGTRQTTRQNPKPTPANQTPGWVKDNILDRQRNRPVYDRIIERFKADRNLAADDDLAKALDWVDDRKAMGDAPEGFFVASPDAAHAVIRPDGKRPLLLIDIATLKTRRLLGESGDRPSPVAWSADSTRLAFKPPGSGELHVYDLKRQNATVVTRQAPPWIEALSWSPDGQRLAAVGLVNRRTEKNPLALVAAGAGHPVFKNDAILFVCGLTGNDPFTVTLKSGITEASMPRAKIEWK